MVFTVGNGGMDPYSSPYIIPNSSPHNPFPHSLLSAKEFFDPGLGGLKFRIQDFGLLHQDWDCWHRGLNCRVAL